MAQWLIAPVALPKIPCSIPITHMVADKPFVTPVPRNPMLSYGLCDHTNINARKIPMLIWFKKKNTFHFLFLISLFSRQTEKDEEDFSILLSPTGSHYRNKTGHMYSLSSFLLLYHPRSGIRGANRCAQVNSLTFYSDMENVYLKSKTPSKILISVFVHACILVCVVRG